MTKRDQIAAMALQGLISNSKGATSIPNDEKITIAVSLADALIAQLKKTAPKKVIKPLTEAQRKFEEAGCGDYL